ncbi:hypothetical protein [Tropicimonas isoalkanivorans]|uniref:Uncharacterized protein n=1 Tax=Tropicimonas isoalkanivorans TaxID=441112 RepID=A0A1I1KQK1_9RHOB|nr:hypothetical protein [Tropicimonas isoalkanivorans]SFC63077.1 hypothetical protein SAMN04488094_10742 [Tropicimonas isoalkanivorans]
MATVAIFGSAGVVGLEIARTMIFQPDVTRLVLVDIAEEKMRTEANDCMMLAEKMRLESVEVIPVVTDLTRDGAIQEVLEVYAPDVSIQAAIPISWYTLANSVPKETWKRVNFEARIGPFLPLLLSFPIKFMEAWRAAGSPGEVIQLSLPDVVNPVLKGMGLAPSCGSGNTENLCSTLRLEVADRLSAPTREVDVRLISHHYHSWFMHSPSDLSDLDDRMFYFRAFWNSSDVTDEIIAQEDFLPKIRKRYPYQRPRFAATSVVKNTVKMLRGDSVITHVCSPASLGGGMDARFTANGWEPVVPNGLTMADAEAIYDVGRKADGIETLAADGTVTFTDKAHGAMQELLGFDCKVLRPEDVHDRRDELLTCIQSLRKAAA